jgi:ribosomal protein S1
MLKINTKASCKPLKILKSNLSCYGVSEERFFESELTQNQNNTVFEFGHKHRLVSSELKSKSNYSNLVISKVKNFETPYNEMLIDFESYRKVQTNNELFKLFKEKFESKSFLKGRVLNNTRKGISIGVCGLVGFLPLNSVVKINKNKTVLLYIESMNISQKLITFSQKNIHKKTHKILLKLASKIVFVFESNLKKR